MEPTQQKLNKWRFTRCAISNDAQLGRLRRFVRVASHGLALGKREIFSEAAQRDLARVVACSAGAHRLLCPAVDDRLPYPAKLCVALIGDE